MTTVRDELMRLIALNYAEQFVPPQVAVQQLAKLGDDLVPGLIGCLEDHDTEVQMLAIQLLGEARATSAVPEIIKRLRDPDRLVRVWAVGALGQFGPPAAAAVPELAPWLFDEMQFLQVLATESILKIDPSRVDQLMPIILEGAKSEDVCAKGIALDLLSAFLHRPHAN